MASCSLTEAILYIQPMSDDMGREFVYLSSHATNRYFIPNWGKTLHQKREVWIYACDIFLQ